MQLVTTAKIHTPPARQAIFRALLEATAYPGRVLDIAESLGGEKAYLGVLSTLVDEETSLADSNHILTETQKSLLSTRIVAVSDAAFVLCDGKTSPSPDFAPRLGTIYRPDLGATILLICEYIGAGDGEMTLSGAGIESTTNLHISGLNHEWMTRRVEWNRHFPQGIDFVLCDSSRIAAIPRTTTVETR